MTVTQTWDVLRAEMSDAMRSQSEGVCKRPRVYCGAPTRSHYQVCLAHDDLLDLDPAYPAKDETA